MKTTLLFLVLALFCIWHITNAYDAESCDANPTLTGYGVALTPKVHFIKATRQCVTFLWGGQGYTQNFFINKEMCEKACLS